jgi:hypothetical protein
MVLGCLRCDIHLMILMHFDPLYHPAQRIVLMRMHFGGHGETSERTALVLFPATAHLCAPLCAQRRVEVQVQSIEGYWTES